MPCRAVSFDLDATLLDNGFIPDNIASCCRFIARRSGVDVATIAKANAEVFASYWPLVEEGWALGSSTGEQVIREVWRRVLVSCGCDSPQLLEDLIGEHLRLDAENARLFDDVHPVVEALRSSGIGLALITNGAADTQRSRLACLGMEEWFDVVVISGELGAVKPSRSVFATAAAGLGVDGTGLWHVGDNLATDVHGAVSAGHTSVWLNREGATRADGDPVPHFEVTSLGELLTLVAG